MQMKSDAEVADGAVLIAAPVGKDAELATAVLRGNGITARPCRDLREAAGIFADPFQGFVLTLSNVGYFSHPLVTLELNGILCGVQPEHPRTVRVRSVAHAELSPEVSADHDWLSEDVVVAQHPRSVHRDEEQSS